MATIGSGGIRPPDQITTQTQSDVSSDAVADTRKAVQQNIEHKLDTTRTTADQFQVKADQALKDPTKTQAQFSKDFAPDVVSFVEQNLNVKIDPAKALKVKAQLQADPVAKQLLGTIKDQVEQINQSFLATWQPPAPPPETPLANLPTQTEELAQTKTADQATTAQTASTQTAAAQTNSANADSATQAKLATTASTVKPPTPQDKAGSGGKKPETAGQKNQQAVQAEKTEDAKKAQLTDQKKIDQTALTAANTTKNLTPAQQEAAAKAALAAKTGTLPGQAGQANEAGGALTPASPVIPATATPTPQSGANSNSGGNASSQSTQPQYTTANEATVETGLSVSQLFTRLDDADAAECALVVLMDVVNDVDLDIKAQQNLLDMRHKVNDAMRQYFQKFENEARSLSGDQSMEWQNMSFDIGYDKAGNMIVTSFPDMTWMTGNYEHVAGKSAHDMSPTDGLNAVVGSAGMQEAKANGTFQQVDSKTAIGLTAYRQIKVQGIPAEEDFIRSQLSAMKQSNDTVSQELQKLMDLRKNVLEQFGKIYQARSDAWDQQIALIAQ